MKLMRKYYRNRHSTFIKAMLEQKKKKQEDQETVIANEKKKKEKIKQKALAAMNEVQPLEADDGTQFQDFSEIDQQMMQSSFKKQVRGNSTIGGRNRRDSSVSTANLKYAAMTGNQEQTVKDIQRNNKMMNAYGMGMSSREKQKSS